MLWGLDEAMFIKQLFWLGFEGCNPEFTRVFHSLAKRATGVLDLGSYLGYYALVAALANPRARVYSVEPLPDSVDYQRRLFSLNGAGNIEVCPVGVAETTGSTSFFVPDRSLSRIPNIGSLINRFGAGTHYSDRESVSLEVDTVTLPDLFTRFGIDRIDLIKFYIEEVETQVFSEGQSVLKRWKPDLLGWIFYRGDNVEKLGALLSGIGYSFLVFRGQALIPCPSLPDARRLGDVHGAERGGRSAVLITTSPETRLSELRRDVPGVAAA